MQQRQNPSDNDYIDMQQQQNEYEQMNGKIQFSTWRIIAWTIFYTSKL